MKTGTRFIDRNSLVILLLVGVIFSTLRPSEVQAESFLERVLRIAGISATPSQQRGASAEMRTGDILTHTLGRGSSRLTWKGGYRSPVFTTDSQSILAVRGRDIVRISLVEDDEETLFFIKGVVKLIGFSKDNSSEMLILTEDDKDHLSAGLLSIKTGEVTPLPHDRDSKEDLKMFRHLRAWERDYGDKQLYLRTEISGTLEWTDVFLKQPGKSPKNISQCNGANCSQPSLSHDDKRIVFINSGN